MELFDIGDDEGAETLESIELPEPPEAPTEEVLSRNPGGFSGAAEPAVCTKSTVPAGDAGACCRSTSLSSKPDAGEVPCLAVGIPPLQSELGKWACKVGCAGGFGGLGRPVEAEGKAAACASASSSTHSSRTEPLGHKPLHAGGFGGSGRPDKAKGKATAWAVASLCPTRSHTEPLGHAVWDERSAI